MKQSEAMLEIRKIRNENSERHIKMSDEERRKESEIALEWLSSILSKPIKTATPNQR